MYYRDRGACFEVWGGGDSTEAIPRRQAGLLSIEKVGQPWPPASPCSAVHAQERIRNSELIASVHKIN
jgi:hypothetical protein